MLYKYDLSQSYANLIILESEKRRNQKSDDEMIKTYYSIYEKILKTIYVPLFIKEPCWEFEHEFRMFLLKHRMTREGMIKMEDFLDKNNNVNLSNAITGIYLGENFYQNKQADVILDDIVKIAESKNITVYKKDEIIYEPSAGK